MSKDIFPKVVSEILAHSTTAEQKIADQPPVEKLFRLFSSHIRSNFSGIKPIETKLVTVFLKADKDIFSVDKQKNSLKITLNAKSGTLVDRRGLLRDVSKVGHWGNGDYQIKLDSTENFDYLCEIIKQIY